MSRTEALTGVVSIVASVVVLTFSEALELRWWEVMGGWIGIIGAVAYMAISAMERKETP